MTLKTIETQEETTDKTTAVDFEKYFKNTDLFELFKFDPSNSHCETLDLLLKRDGFPYEKTPTNEKHIEYLRSLSLIKGISLNSNLYT
jgi:hypothetical protein